MTCENGPTVYEKRGHGNTIGKLEEKERLRSTWNTKRNPKALEQISKSRSWILWGKNTGLMKEK